MQACHCSSLLRCVQLKFRAFKLIGFELHTSCIMMISFVLEKVYMYDDFTKDILQVLNTCFPPSASVAEEK